jgi:hypothetical protein
MKKQSFRTFVARHKSRLAKEIVTELPDVENWGELRIHIRRHRISDEKLVEARTLWREYERASESLCVKALVRSPGANRDFKTK